MIVGHARVGRYDIERHVASGGMAEVYQARDIVSGAIVALKIPHDGEEIWEAEKTGATLQIQLSNRDPRVPRVHEIGDGAERFVAMEYVEGEDLSRHIQSGPIAWREAVRIAIELCGVLATARSCAQATGEAGGIVHGDIKPRNIRIREDGRVQMLDFGIAKALRQTRAETRNLYGSVPYSSPERLDRGHVDYRSDLWSVAVVLYEMLEGKRPFRAGSDPELERSIRSGSAPSPFECPVPAECRAVLGKALAFEVDRRYPSATELELDLRALLAGCPTFAGHEMAMRMDAAPGAAPEVASRAAFGEVNAEDDPDATRRTAAPKAGHDSEATRRTGSGDSDATRRTTSSRVPATNGAASAPVSAGADARVSAPAMAPPPVARPSYAQATEAGPADAPAHPRGETPRASGPARRLRIPGKALLVLLVVVLTARELVTLGNAADLRSSLASRPRGDANAVWNEYQRLARGHLLVNLSGLNGAVREWLVSHADDLISRYRSDTPTLYESGWRAAESLLQRAAQLDPGNRRVQARLEFCRAHLLRLAARDSKVRDEAMSRYDEGLNRFERAIRLWPGWPDPYIGMAQIDAYGKKDPERTSDALDKARQEGYPFGEREAALLGDAYRLRAERRSAGDTEAFDADQNYRHLERIREDVVQALAQYETIPSYPGASRNLRSLRQRLSEIDARMRNLTGEAPPADEPTPESSQ